MNDAYHPHCGGQRHDTGGRDAPGHEELLTFVSVVISPDNTVVDVVMKAVDVSSHLGVKEPDR